MTLLVAAYLAGAFTLLTPCILPILPFVLVRTGASFRDDVLPMLLGLALAFAVMASLAAFAGGWAVAASQYGRSGALVLMVFFGLTLLLPGLAARVSAPVVALGTRILERDRSASIARGGRTVSSALLGIATGMIWAPCAGPILGVILTTAALNGPGAATFLLLLSYGLGAASALAAVLLLGTRLLERASRAVSSWLRPVFGAAIIAGAALIAAGLDTGLLRSWSAGGTQAVEQQLLEAIKAPLAPRAAAASLPELSLPLTTLAAGNSWLNGRLGAEALRGKVVLVNFWTYSCINCLRALPYVRAWAEKYRPQGLVVIGVHTPEFAFEKDIDNVDKATRMLGVTYPVVLDNDFAIWRAFGNRAWPALYFVGADGEIRSYALGEGNYEESERLIQELLSEAGNHDVQQAIAAVTGDGAQAAPDLRNLETHETYLGYARATGFASGDPVITDAPAEYHAPTELDRGSWGLDGRWRIDSEFATLAGESGRIAYRFHARDLHLVMAPASAGKPVRFRVTLDGAAPGLDHGADIDAAGWGLLKEDRLYQLIRQQAPGDDRTFTIEFFDPGVRAYAFTFG